MKIAIIGTRGIPNQYGGFEQFAMFFAEFLSNEGHQITVYNSSKHPYKEKKWKGVTIQHCYDPEDTIGTTGQFIYDLMSILDTRKKDFDIIFQLGYTSSSVWSFLFPKKSKIITNMDGLEWKRTKYNKFVSMFLKKAEKWAINNSDELIADSIGIQKYIKDKYEKDSIYIPYGANIFQTPNKLILDEYLLKAGQYNLIIARLEPENNIEPVIKAHIQSTTHKLCIIGNYNTKYGQTLHSKYCKKVHFFGSIYNINKLNNLRYYASIYFHGHSVGGTNPSLLEAMACNCFIIANDNEFNRSVLEKNAIYFKNDQDILNHLQEKNLLLQKRKFTENNQLKIETTYSFQSVHQKLLTLINNTI